MQAGLHPRSYVTFFVSISGECDMDFQDPFLECDRIFWDQFPDSGILVQMTCKDTMMRGIC